MNFELNNMESLLCLQAVQKSAKDSERKRCIQTNRQFTKKNRQRRHKIRDKWRADRQTESYWRAKTRKKGGKITKILSAKINLNFVKVSL